jgi:hypothetical protein
MSFIASSVPVDRFPGEPREIHIEPIAEDHGKFVIGTEERDFSK